MVDVPVVVVVDEEVASIVVEVGMEDVFRISSSPIFHLCYLHHLQSTHPSHVRYATGMVIQLECVMIEEILLMLRLLVRI